MYLSNPRWGAPRIHGELLKLGIDVGETSVALYMVRGRKPPSQTWRTSLDNHLRQIVAVDFFVVPTLTFRVLFVFVVLAHDRRRTLHFNVTSHPTAEWTAQQIREAFAWKTAPRFLLHDRNGIYGKVCRDCVKAMGVEEVKTAPQSPWQNPFAERLIGSIRRECLDNVIVFNKRALKRKLRSYVDYYQNFRTHLSLDKDAPITRQVQSPELGRVSCRRAASSLPSKSCLRDRDSRSSGNRLQPKKSLASTFGYTPRFSVLDSRPYLAPGDCAPHG